MLALQTSSGALQGLNVLPQDKSFASVLFDSLLFVYGECKNYMSQPTNLWVDEKDVMGHSILLTSLTR